ncbi:MAG: Hint domain-containing protein [Anaerolineales bacterium]
MRFPLNLLVYLVLLLSVACAPALPSETWAGNATAIPAEQTILLPENIHTPLSTTRLATPLPPPTFTPIPTVSGGLSPTELKYRILEAFPDFFFCDPDFYPIPRDNERERARARLAEMQANAEMFSVILRHHNLEGRTAFSDQELLAIYRDYKRLLAIPFTAEGAIYRFQIQIGAAEGRNGSAISGRIDGKGHIEVDERKPATLICPICLAAGTRIATPRGDVSVEELHNGDLVWTIGKDGQRVAVPLLSVGKAPTPPGHQMIHLRLADGREVWASPGHPTADGRRVGDLVLGDKLDGSILVAIAHVPYSQPFTYDILPSGSGLYWANGILLASTLKP